MTGNNGKTLQATTIPQAKRLSVSETDEGLVQIEIQLRRFHLFVTEADGFTRFKLNSLVTELLKDIGEPTEYDERVRANMITEVWAPLSVCSSGEVPTREQFISLPQSDLAFWVTTAKELGHEFAWLDGLNRIYETTVAAQEADKADLKKKEKTARGSTRNS